MEKIILTIPAYDPEGRRIPDSAVHYWNGTTPDSVENEKLKIQVKSFEQYRAEVAVKKLADKMLIDNLFIQLAEAKAAPLMNNVAVNNEIIEKLDSINEKLNSTNATSATVNTKQILREIFVDDSSTSSSKPLTKKQIEAAEIEALQAKRAIDMLNKRKALKK